jgi:hypothetical protein
MSGRRIINCFFAVCVLGLLHGSLLAQSKDVAAIEDNSFMVEEAFNQEKNVIQHINTFTRTNDHTWVYTFTEEWPFPGHERHQLSVTTAALSSSDFAGSGGGMGDVALNYRYQVAGGGGQRFSFSPRFSLLLPTGSARYGRGTGGTGVQTNLPVSVYVNRKFITHWNAGATFVPSARNEFGDRAAVNGYNLGQSMIWLAYPRFNVMLETIWTGSQSVVGHGQTQRNHDLLIGPGIRWAHNFNNGLQIVPGISVPMGVGPSAGNRGVTFYLSFEHPIGPTETK